MIKKYVARDIMTTPVITTVPTATMREAAMILYKHRISGMPVVEDGTIVGILSERDCIRWMRQRLDREEENQEEDQSTVAKYMTRQIYTIPSDLAISEICSLFLEYPYRRLPVVDNNGLLVGIISRRDLLKIVQKR